MSQALLTIKEVQAATKLSRTKVYELLGTEIPKVYIGTAVRVRQEALDAWIRSKEEPATTRASSPPPLCPTCGNPVDPPTGGRIISLQAGLSRNTP